MCIENNYLKVLKDNIRVLLKLEYGTDIEVENDWDLLWYLLRNDKKELIEDLIENGFDLNIDNLGDTLLIRASRYGFLLIIDKLIKYGVDINAQNVFEDTPLILASRNNHLGSVRLLLENGADPNMNNHNHFTALYWANHYNNPKIIKLLMRYGAKEYD